jgi:hypothetical protein
MDLATAIFESQQQQRRQQLARVSDCLDVVRRQHIGFSASTVPSQQRHVPRLMLGTVSPTITSQRVSRTIPNAPRKMKP